MWKTTPARCLLKVVSEGLIGETYNIGGHSRQTNRIEVETICALDGLFAQET
jgi:dTDP-glucose 4,6-dehydratase